MPSSAEIWKLALAACCALPLAACVSYSIQKEKERELAEYNLYMKSRDSSERYEYELCLLPKEDDRVFYPCHMDTAEIHLVGDAIVDRLAKLTSIPKDSIYQNIRQNNINETVRFRGDGKYDYDPQAKNTRDSKHQPVCWSRNKSWGCDTLGIMAGTEVGGFWYRLVRTDKGWQVLRAGPYAH
jgi:hypothetical protein